MSAMHRAAAERKAALIAQSERARRRLVAALPMAGGPAAPEAQLAASVASLLRQPAAIGVAAVVLVALGPRRLFSAVRWAAMTLPLHPLGRRVLSALGDRLVSALSGPPNGGRR